MELHFEYPTATQPPNVQTVEVEVVGEAFVGMQGDIWDACGLLASLATQLRSGSATGAKRKNSGPPPWHSGATCDSEPSHKEFDVRRSQPIKNPNPQPFQPLTHLANPKSFHPPAKLN